MNNEYKTKLRILLAEFAMYLENDTGAANDDHEGQIKKFEDLIALVGKDSRDLQSLASKLFNDVYIVGVNLGAKQGGHKFKDDQKMQNTIAELLLSLKPKGGATE